LVIGIGWQGIPVGWWQPCLRLDFELSLPMEPEFEEEQ
jgi:hypothetical protein